MFFEILPVTTDERPDREAVIRKRWVYRQGTVESPGDAVCQSAADLDSEESCRRNIAGARKSFGGARFAKVVAR